MSQDKRDQNKTDRAQSSAQPDDKSKSSDANKPSESPAPNKGQAGGTGPSASGSKKASGASPSPSDGKPSTGSKSGASGPSDADKSTSTKGEASSKTNTSKAGRDRPSDAGKNAGKPGDANHAGGKASTAGSDSSSSKSSGPSGMSSAGGADKNADQDKNKSTTASSASSASAAASATTAKSPSSGAKTSSDTRAGSAQRSGASHTSASTGASGKSTAPSSSGARTGGTASAAGGSRAGTTGSGGTKDGGKRRSLGLAVAVVALIVALLAAASTGYLWYRGQQRIADLDSRINTVEKGLQHNVQNVVMPKLSDMSDRIGQFSQRVDQLSQALDQRKQQIAKLQQTIAHVQTQNKQLSDQLGGDHSQFVEQRIALLLEAANQRLQVERDPKGAAQALSLADKAIQRSGDPALHAVRAKIANEMAVLKALPNPDIEGLSLKLSNVIQQIPKLPVKSNVPSSYQAQPAGGQAASSNESAGNGSDNSMEFAGIKLAKKWHQFVDSVGNALSRMVTIRRANGTENAPALMAPDQSYFLVQNLQLQLRTARLALLNGNAQTYDDALSEARNWIRKYFDTDDSSVSAVLDDLSQLSHVKLDWQAPDLSGSLKTLRQIMDRDQNNGSDKGGKNGQPSGQSDASNGDAAAKDQGQSNTDATDNADTAGSS